MMRSIPTAIGEPFEPHITLGQFDRAADAEQVARIVERQHLPMHGRVEELALLRRDGDAAGDARQRSSLGPSHDFSRRKCCHPERSEGLFLRP